ncbi:CsbD family protein [Neorhodopirellula pilleata]|uniref:CsbD-like domain-containing protein n=1 Tax=Neorhodopirellula pilleata TaxID=2714738 RepID=A0A5C6AUS0_9BACT|nr:hypothetical protein Pla100_01350 [Neorhodopirellula pilleata]
MSNREELQGHWNQVKGRLKEHWGQLTEDDLQRAKGSADQLVGVVQEKTGAARAEVETFLDHILNESLADQASQKFNEFSDVAGQLAADASAYTRERAQQFAAQSSEYSARINETIRTRPLESLAIAFGVGIFAGAMVFMNRKR